jgi:hypothetical protein
MCSLLDTLIFSCTGERFAARADEADDSLDPTESLPAASNRSRSQSFQGGLLHRLEESRTSLLCEV